MPTLLKPTAAMAVVSMATLPNVPVASFRSGIIAVPPGFVAVTVKPTPCAPLIAAKVAAATWTAVIVTWLFTLMLMGTPPTSPAIVEKAAPPDMPLTVKVDSATVLSILMFPAVPIVSLVR